VLGPAPVLALLVGIFHTGLYVLIRGTAGGQMPLLIAAAFLGAWAGDALGARLGIDLFPPGVNPNVTGGANNFSRGAL